MSLNPIRRHLADDPVPWALCLMMRRAAHKLKSACLGPLFGARGLYLGPGSIVKGSRSIRFGANLYANGHLWLEAVRMYNLMRFQPVIEIGDDVSISERVHITSIDRIQIGSGVLIGSGVYIGDHQHGIYNGVEQSDPFTAPALRTLGGGGPVFIGNNVWIGDNSVILGPVSIGRGSIIGANSVVRSDIPDFTIAAGAPARPLKRFNESTGQWEHISATAQKTDVFNTTANLLTGYVTKRR
jgi:acetyltransferase-like isoleucine patch superfamily enzyme